MTFSERILCFVTITCFLHLARPSNLREDTLLQGHQLTATNRLISSSGLFTMCFFQPDGSEDTNKFYLGISAEVQNYYFWVANRDKPIHDDSGVLTIDEYGNLKILSNRGHSTIVLYSVEAVSNSINAILLDTGNFVLREMNPDGSVKKVLWQSFDYPTDTLMPGMRLGFDKNTGQIWSLTSRRSAKSLGSGSFTLGLDPTTSQLVYWWRGKIVWSSGQWKNGSFVNLNSPLYKKDFNFTYFSNESVTYLKYASVSGYITMGPFGTLYGVTGASYSCAAGYTFPGCAMPRTPKCREADGLYLPSRTGYGVMSKKGFKFDESENLTITDCWMKCLNNCSCEAFSYANHQEVSGCEIWSRGTANFIVTNVTADGREIFIFRIGTKVIAPPPVHGQKINAPLPLIAVSNADKRRIWIIIATLGALLLIISCFTCIMLWRKRKERAEKRNQRTNLFSDIEGNTVISAAYSEGREQRKESNDTQIFDFETILAATNNFSITNKIGEGGFGPVYKGKLPNGQEIAIKRLSKSSGQGLVEFKNEAMLIVKLQHTNLVRLLGFCIDREERILVYEYMSNKSLNLYIFDTNKRNMLEWKIRCRIIEGVAQGLVYLHQYSRLKVIHRDLKASNILLDNELNPKISDFGMARIFGLTKSEEKTNRIVGTYGYMSPEYAMRGVISTKTDVYSFGILLLEIVSGKKNNSDYPLNLIAYAWKLWNEGEALKLIDTTLDGSFPPIQVLRCIHIGLLCTQDQARDRPAMLEVVYFLSNEIAQLPPPKQPGFCTIAAVEELEQHKSYSINEITISVTSGR